MLVAAWVYVQKQAALFPALAVGVCFIVYVAIVLTTGYEPTRTHRPARFVGFSFIFFLACFTFLVIDAATRASRKEIVTDTLVALVVAIPLCVVGIYLWLAETLMPYLHAYNHAHRTHIPEVFLETGTEKTASAWVHGRLSAIEAFVSRRGEVVAALHEPQPKHRLEQQRLFALRRFRSATRMLIAAAVGWIGALLAAVSLH